MKTHLNENAANAAESEGTEKNAKPTASAARIGDPPLHLVRPEQKRRVAVIDDDDGVLIYLQDLFNELGFCFLGYKCAEDFFSDLDKNNANSPMQNFVDAILCDIRLPGIDGISVIKKTHGTIGFNVPIVLITAFSSAPKAVEAIKEGAYDYLEKPFDPSRLSLVLENAMRLRQVSIENSRLRGQVTHETLKLQGILCTSPAMRVIYDLVKRVAQTSSSVLVTGESGVGKEVIARAIHDNSDRAAKPFVSINCSAIPESLLESELFGHSKGSFTGASQHRRGLFEEADGGTLFLDEIGDLDCSLQVKLLRVLQEQKIRPVGDNKFRTVNVRIITATHKNLAAEIRSRRFREDLYYRLNVIPIHIPPLRQRKEDIPALSAYFLEKFSRKNDIQLRGFTEEAMTKLMHLPWKGNVRELQNVIERSVVLSSGAWIEEADIPIWIEQDSTELGEVLSDLGQDLPSLKDFEKRYILSVLQKNNGKKDAAAKTLGLSRRTLYRKLSIARSPRVEH